MKKKMKRFFASVLAFAMMFSTLTFTSAAAEDEYQMFLAIGADAEADGDWGYQYYGNGASSNAGDVTATDATAKVGDTVTIGVSFPTEVVYTWFMAPVLVAENAGNVDYTIDSVLQENNEAMCREVRESILKEMDYQFRMQEEREDEREAAQIKRDEEHFRRVDELLRKKRGLLWNKDDRKTERKKAEQDKTESVEEQKKAAVKESAEEFRHRNSSRNRQGRE